MFMKEFCDDSVALLRKMVTIPSLTGTEDELCRTISMWMDERGIAHRRYGNNLVAANISSASNPVTILLDAHIDTVPATSSYTRDPFDPGNDKDTVWGLGSNDDGGCVVSMIAVYRHYLAKSNDFNLILSLTCDEEKSGDSGAGYLYTSDGPFAKGTYPVPDFAIIGEPTGMRAATSERGLLVIDGMAVGASGHAARNEGVNALYIAIEDISRLRSYVFDRHSEEMGDVKLTVTQIQAGMAHNIIPDKCSFVVDIRPTDLYDNAEILSALQKICKSQLTARRLTNRSSCTPAGSPIRKAISSLGIESYSSPTTSNWITIGYPAVKMGPGESSRSHKADEFIKVEEISGAIRGYCAFIDKLVEYGNTME